MTLWRLIDSGPCAASFNMALDDAIAAAVREGAEPPTLRFYGWQCPSVSIGHFQRIADVDPDYCSRENIPVVQRPTGGRAVFHGHELTYSFSSPNDGIFSGGLFETYRLLGRALEEAFRLAGLTVTVQRSRKADDVRARSPLCFESTSFGEISCRGIKLAGSAQRRYRDGFLQQGAIPFSVDSSRLARVFRRPAGSAGPGMVAGLADFLPGLRPDVLRLHVIESFERLFSVTLERSHPSPREQERALQLAERTYRNLCLPQAG